MGDVNISKGTCYTSTNTVTKGNFIPCGNAANRHWPCCHAGDVCLGFTDSNACFAPDSGNTYIGGCTDSGYSDPTCPWRGTLFQGQQWVPLQQCGKNADGNTKWGGCKVPDDMVELERLPHSACDPYCSATPLYVGLSVIPGYANLPPKAGGRIQYTGGFSPTNTPTSTLPVQASNSTPNMPAPAPAPATNGQLGPSNPAVPIAPPKGTDHEFSTGAKVATGLGVAGGALFSAVVVLLFMLLRRRRAEQKNMNPQYDNLPPGPPTTHYAASTMSSPPPPESAQPWYSPHQPLPRELVTAGIKTELPAEVQYKSELPANEPVLVVAPAPDAPPSPSPLSTYMPTPVASTVNRTSVSFITPQSTGDRPPLPSSPPLPSQQQQQYQHQRHLSVESASPKALSDRNA